MNPNPPLVVDGSMGEGGGQVLRTALSLSLCLGRSFRIVRIRANRVRPGLRRQHLTAVLAAAEISAARVEGAAMGSEALMFEPGPVVPGVYRFAMGTAGSTTLVLQTVLPALMLAAGPSTVWLEGGTHNPMAPPFEFLAESFLPLLRRIGPKVDAELIRPGFYPAGGGRCRIGIAPAARLSRLDLTRRGDVLECRARALIAHLPRHIAERELEVVSAGLGWSGSALQVVEIEDTPGPGNLLSLSIRCEHVTSVHTAFGRRGIPAERVAGDVVHRVRRHLATGVPVDEHLADQLLLPLALARGGTYRTLPPTPHTLTNAGVIRQFLATPIRMTGQADGSWLIGVGNR